jgi:ABC-type polysaccharide/polyol phosphate export permease
MFATAVVYPLPRERLGPVLGTVLRLNPMTPIIEGYRAAVIEGRVPDFADAAPALIIVALTFWIGLWAFDRAQYLFAERV